ncbi:MAG: hypothetical protein AAF449_05810, partial [Myxococcota bacterium]
MLTALDPSEFARSFGAYVRKDGLFLPCEELLPPGTPVHVELQYGDTTVAMTGEGHVLRAENDPVPGLDLAIDWSPESRSLVSHCLFVDDGIDTRSLIADLQLPEPSSPPSPSAHSESTLSGPALGAPISDDEGRATPTPTDSADVLAAWADQVPTSVYAHSDPLIPQEVSELEEALELGAALEPEEVPDELIEFLDDEEEEETL